MTREHVKQMMPIFQAYAEGKTIQYRDSTALWGDVEQPVFVLPPEYYRIKPEPRRFWVVTTHVTGNHVFTTHKDALKFANAHAGLTEVIATTEDMKL